MTTNDVTLAADYTITVTATAANGDTQIDSFVISIVNPCLVLNSITLDPITSPITITEGDAPSSVTGPTYTLDPNIAQCWDLSLYIIEDTAVNSFNSQVTPDTVTVDTALSHGSILIPQTTKDSIEIKTYYFTYFIADQNQFTTDSATFQITVYRDCSTITSL